MEPFAFSAPATGEVRFIPAGYGNSLMQLREAEFPGTDACAGTEPLPGTVPLARFFSLMRKLGVQTLAVDEPELSRDIAEENEDLRTYGRFGERCRVTRITALKAIVKSEDQLAELSDTVWLGVAIWKEDTGLGSDGREEVCRRIFESVARRGDENHIYVRGEPERNVVCGPAKRKLRGNLFCQQNGLTNVCSHAALRTATDCIMPGGLSYRRINELAGIDHRSVTLYTKAQAKGGLSPEEIKTVLIKSGLEVNLCVYHKREPDHRVDRISYQDRLYGTMESGFPALMVFGSVHDEDVHVVPVFGHTMNRDMWGPRAEGAYFPEDHYFPMGRVAGFSPSHLWLSAFIMHDDGLGQNYCVPKHYLTAMKRILPPSVQQRKIDELAPFRQHIAELAALAGEAGANTTKEIEKMMAGTEATSRLDCGVAYVLSLRPAGVRVDGADVLPGACRLMQLLYNYLWTGGDALKRILDALTRRTLILRPLLIDAATYLGHLSRLRDWTPPSQGVPAGSACTADERAWAADALKEVVGPLWMVEVSIPELFPANLRKTGELLIRPEFDPREKRWLEAARLFDPQCGLVFARLPGLFLAPERMTAGTLDIASAEEPENVSVFWCHQQRCSLRSHVALFGAEDDPGNRPPE